MGHIKNMVPSSSGPGRGPLKAKTRVQISLGPPTTKKLTFLGGLFLLFTVSPRIELVESSGKPENLIAKNFDFFYCMAL